MINSISTPVTTRFATTKDAAVLSEIGRKTFHETFAAVNKAEDMKMYLEKTFTTLQLTAEIEDRANTFMLALEGDVVAGYVKVREQKNAPGLNGEVGIEIEGIYVRKEYLGKKVGGLLMQQCLELAKQKGYALVWLGVWEHNTKAIAFYEKWGFEKFGSHPFLLGTDLQTDFLMKKYLN